MPAFVTEYPQFFTASIKGWYKLLEHDKYKDIIINSLRFLVEDNQIKLYAFSASLGVHYKKHAVAGVFLHRPHDLKQSALCIDSISKRKLNGALLFASEDQL